MPIRASNGEDNMNVMEFGTLYHGMIALSCRHGWVGCRGFLPIDDVASTKSWMSKISYVGISRI